MNIKHRLMNKTMTAGLALLLALSPLPALAGGAFTPGLPAVTQLNGTEQFPLDTMYPSGISPQSAYATTNTMSSALGSRAGATVTNGLVGGDFGQNLWQRGTTSASITTALVFGPDRWAGLSGTGTAFTIIKETAAADITQAFAASARVQRTAAQTGVIATCIYQVLTSANSTRFQGQLTEFVFHALAGANFSAANSNITATIAYGTGTDQSLSSFSTAGWTGQANVVSTAIPISTTWSRYSVVGTVPLTATQLGVSICFTPVGTAGANDWFEFTGAQLDPNPGAVALTGATSVLGSVGSAKAFSWRPQETENVLQYTYFYRLSEPASTAAVDGMCQAIGANTNICNVYLPTPMRAATPTIAITTAGTFKVNIAGTPTTIASPVASVCSSNSCAVTAGNTNTAGQAELLSGGGGTGAWDISAEL